MSTKIFLSNDPSDLSGYLKAYINEKGPSTSTTQSTAVTTTTGSGSNIQMTLTAGGSAAKWITVPLAAAVTVSTAPFVNYWGLEAAASANSQITVKLCQYTTSLQSAFLVSSTGTELGTAAARTKYVPTETVTSTAFAVGDRLAITPYIDAVGTMGASTATMDYNQSTSASDGDSFVILNEDLEPGTAQVGGGSYPGVKGYGVSYFYNLANTVQNAQNAGLFDSSATAQTIIDEANNQKALV